MPVAEESFLMTMELLLWRSGEFTYCYLGLFVQFGASLSVPHDRVVTECTVAICCWLTCNCCLGVAFRLFCSSALENGECAIENICECALKLFNFYTVTLRRLSYMCYHSLNIMYLIYSGVTFTFYYITVTLRHLPSRVTMV